MNAWQRLAMRCRLAEPARLLARAVYVSAALACLTYFAVLVRLRPESVLRGATRAPSIRPQNGMLPPNSLVYTIASAVARAAALHPSTPQCLERALTIRVLLALNGTSSRVVIGVARPEMVLAAHAWIEIDGCSNDIARDAFVRLVEL